MISASEETSCDIMALSTSSSAMYVMKGEYKKGMNKLSKVMEWYITMELLPKPSCVSG